MKISERFIELQNKIQTLKEEYLKYITNKDISLEERWSTFINAPQELKEHDTYGPKFKNLPNDFVMYEGPIHADRYNTINIKDMFEEIESVFSEIKEGTYEPIYEWHIESYNQLNLNALKEEILLKNIGSFNYDW